MVLKLPGYCVTSLTYLNYYLTYLGQFCNSDCLRFINYELIIVFENLDSWIYEVMSPSYYLMNIQNCQTLVPCDPDSMLYVVRIEQLLRHVELLQFNMDRRTHIANRVKSLYY